MFLWGQGQVLRVQPEGAWHWADVGSLFSAGRCDGIGHYV